MRETCDKALAFQRGGHTLARRRTDVLPLHIVVPADDPALCLAPRKTEQSVSSCYQQNQISHEPTLLEYVFVITGVIPVIKDLEFPSAKNFFFFLFEKGWWLGIVSI